MKKNLWLILTAAISTSLFAQDATNTPPVLQAPPPPPPSTTPTAETPPTMEAPTNAPAAKPKSAKKKTARKKTVMRRPEDFKTVPLVPGPAVVSANHVNVRSKAGLVGEVITRMTNGEPVTVIEEVHLKMSGPEEPSAWAKVALPSDAHVWLKSSYLDTNNMVKASKLKLRAGPGENYGVVGIINKGDQVQPIETKGDWTQVQAPTNAYAFIAAQYLKQGEEVAAAAPTAVPETPMATNAVTEMPPVAPATNEIAAGTETNAPTTAMAETNPPAPAVEEPPLPRIVSHEGIVRYTFSIQAPTRFELVSPDNHKTINYLYTPTTNLDLNRYKGMDIIVTGEEGLDERWKNTPVITIQDIKVLQ